jgi:hypothetical protein
MNLTRRRSDATQEQYTDFAILLVSIVSNSFAQSRCVAASLREIQFSYPGTIATYKAFRDVLCL